MASLPEVQIVEQGPGVRRKDHEFTFGPVEFVVVGDIPADVSSRQWMNILDPREEVSIGGIM